MAHEVEEALEETKQLLKWDPAGDDTVTIKQARAREEAIRDQLWSKTVRESRAGDEAGTSREIFELPMAELVFTEIWLTFTDSTLKRKGKILFTPAMTRSQFKGVYDTLPVPLLREWRKAVLEVNPQWDPTRADDLGN